VQSKEYSSKLLNQVSKVRKILTRRNSTENFETGLGKSKKRTSAPSREQI